MLPRRKFLRLSTVEGWVLIRIQIPDPSQHPSKAWARKEMAGDQKRMKGTAMVAPTTKAKGRITGSKLSIFRSLTHPQDASQPLNPRAQPSSSNPPNPPGACFCCREGAEGLRG
mmetsp:Transcript_35884/g.55971  ORF Transcript_35884/g.55971 Transcript_35884/m.55971 type:complete len:114 (+) Transcript_35884:560-901(+)